MTKRMYRESCALLIDSTDNNKRRNNNQGEGLTTIGRIKVTEAAVANWEISYAAQSVATAAYREGSHA